MKYKVGQRVNATYREGGGTEQGIIVKVMGSNHKFYLVQVEGKQPLFFREQALVLAREQQLGLI